MAEQWLAIDCLYLNFSCYVWFQICKDSSRVIILQEFSREFFEISLNKKGNTFSCQLNTADCWTLITTCVTWTCFAPSPWPSFTRSHSSSLSVVFTVGGTSRVATNGPSIHTRRSSEALVSLLGNITGNPEGYNTRTCSPQNTNQRWSGI